ncbi:uncharacterized protein LOC129959545 isoform X2 [Argiope bruennichi]|uniref:uncharacterized protein LOC129959545 isoform X2 n=1 Tax=Argiope bruennichi TaxID=94029 RepID=UPI002494F4D6|nr:uncharacterized protein LOC129959545 isoform X2 [Argiope bruennichi]
MFGMKRDEKYFEVSDVDNVENLPKDAWKVRPCEWYKEEYKDCKSIKARFHQYFVYGDTVDCTQWKNDYMNCMHFRKKHDLESLENYSSVLIGVLVTVWIGETPLEGNKSFHSQALRLYAHIFVLHFPGKMLLQVRMREKSNESNL